MIERLAKALHAEQMAGRWEQLPDPVKATYISDIRAVLKTFHAIATERAYISPSMIEAELGAQVPASVPVGFWKLNISDNHHYIADAQDNPLIYGDRDGGLSGEEADLKLASQAPYLYLEVQRLKEITNQLSSKVFHYEKLAMDYSSRQHMAEGKTQRTLFEIEKLRKELPNGGLKKKS